MILLCDALLEERRNGCRWDTELGSRIVIFCCICYDDVASRKLFNIGRVGARNKVRNVVQSVFIGDMVSIMGS